MFHLENEFVGTRRNKDEIIRANIDALPKFAHSSFLESGCDIAIQRNIGGVAKCILIDRTYPKPMLLYPPVKRPCECGLFWVRRYKLSQKQRELICAFPERRNAFLQFCRGTGRGAAANEDENPKPQHAGSQDNGTGTWFFRSLTASTRHSSGVRFPPRPLPAPRTSSPIGPPPFRRGAVSRSN